MHPWNDLGLRCQLRVLLRQCPFKGLAHFRIRILQVLEVIPKFLLNLPPVLAPFQGFWWLYHHISPWFTSGRWKAPLQLVHLLTAAPGLRIHREKVPGREHSSHLGGSFHAFECCHNFGWSVQMRKKWFNPSYWPSFGCKFLIVYQRLVA